MSDYTLPDLPYDLVRDFGALEPYYSAEMLELHHDKHHAGYVAGANTKSKNWRTLANGATSEQWSGWRRPSHSTARVTFCTPPSGRIFRLTEETSRTGTLLQRLSSEDERIVVLSQHHRGVGAARNMGLAAATVGVEEINFVIPSNQPSGNWALFFNSGSCPDGSGIPGDCGATEGNSSPYVLLPVQ